MDIVVFGEIISYLDLKSTIYLSSVCKDFRKFIKSSDIRFKIVKLEKGTNIRETYMVDFLGNKDGFHHRHVMEEDKRVSILEREFQREVDFIRGNLDEIPLDIWSGLTDVYQSTAEDLGLSFPLNPWRLDTITVSFLESSSYYKNNLLEGEKLVYHQKDKLKSSTMYRLGKRDGISSNYSLDGKLESTSLYKNDVLVYQKKFFPENGYKLQVMKEEGKLDYTISSNPPYSSIIHYLDNEKHGLSYTFKDNKLIRTVNFDRGVSISMSDHYNNGRICKHTIIGLVTSTMEFYPNGKVKRFMQHIEPYSRHGLYLEYDSKGDVVKHCYYVNDRIHGIKKKYSNGVLIESHYHYGKKI